MKTAIVFPGQGAQSTEMMTRYAAHPLVAQTIDEAAAVLDEDLSSLITAPGELDKTINTQPILLAVGVGVFRAANLPMAAAMAGHSLGEYTALVCADAIDFAAAVRLVRRRGELMQQAANGAMLAVLAVSPPLVEECCEAVRAGGGKVWAANYNSPQQTVIAGDAESVVACRDLLLSRGAKKIVPLPVSIPSHCPLMQSAADAFTQDLNAIEWRAPTPPVIHNATLRAAAADEIAAALTAQLTQPVRWVQTIESFAAADVATIYECGPGGVLSGLGKRIKNAPPHVPLANSDNINALNL